jgi:hypothetical protein
VNADINTAAAISLSKLATGALPSGITVSSANIVDDTIVNADINASAAIAITKIAQGTANQLIGANAGATANEYKTLAVGTTGTNFAIAHAANSVTFNLPDASAANRGAITTGTQTIAGAKTLSGITTVSNATATTAFNNGALVVSGGIGAAGAIMTRNGQVQIGNTRSGDGAAQLDLIGVNAGTTFNGQLIRASGTNGNLSLLNTGTGTTIINNNAGTGTGNGVLVQGLRTATVINTTVGATYGAATGYVGEILYNSLAASLSYLGTEQSAQIGTITLTPGVWLVTTNVNCDANSGSISRVQVCIATAALTFEFNAATQLACTGTGGCAQAVRVMVVTSNLPVYGFGIVTPAAASSARIIGDNSAPERSYLRAIRIA